MTAHTHCTDNPTDHTETTLDVHQVFHYIVCQHNGHEAFQQQQRPEEEQLAQQQWEADRQLRAEATIIAAQTSSQLHAEFRMMEYDTSTEKGEFNRIQMQEFAIQTEDAFDAQRPVYAQAGGEEVKRRKNASCTGVEKPREHIWNPLPRVRLLMQPNLIFKDSYAMPNWSAGITSRGTMNSGASLLQKGIDCKIKNRFWRIKHGHENINIIKK